MRCINCGIAVKRLRRHEVSSISLPLQKKLMRWISTEVPVNAYICQQCFILLNSEASHERSFGHIMVCRGCGTSVGRARLNIIQSDNPLFGVILSWNKELTYEARIFYACHACWLKANRYSLHQSARESQGDKPAIRNSVTCSETPLAETCSETFSAETCSETSSAQIPITSPLPDIEKAPIQPAVKKVNICVINLPHFKRASKTSSHCVFDKCKGKPSHLVPAFIKKMILRDYNFYISRKCRVCKRHLISDEWHILPHNSLTFSTFSALEIEDIINLSKANTHIMNFEKVTEMSNKTCHYWTGLTVSEFLALFNKLPKIKTRTPKRALAIYLIKLRTGDSNRRLSTLFNLSIGTIHNLLKIAKNNFEHYLLSQNPKNIGNISVDST